MHPRRPRRRRPSRRTLPAFSRRSARPVTGRIRSPRCPWSPTKRHGRGRARSGIASRSRQMPPWHIDKTIGIQDFKNDRSLSDEQIDTVVRWVDAGAPKGDREGHAAAEGVADRAGLELRQAVRAEGTRPDRQVAAVDAEGRRERRVVEARRRNRTDRSALGARHRDSAEHGEGPPHHPSRDCPPPAARGRSARRQRRRRDRQPAAGHVHGVGRRQAGRDHAAGQRQADAAGLEDRLGHPLLERRRRHHRHRRTGRLLLSERPGAEVPPGAAPDGRDQRRRRGHSAKHGEGDRRLLRDARERPRRELSSRTCTCAARRCRWRRSCRTGRRRC